ncbi:hypothetical protein ACIRQY_22590 [Streptomyces sp. NPDC101490]|uniref:hypothetical protein n=1 Tax=unclassified Streptomyces TaxID=2593676 RepID=UPI00332C91E1
MWHRKAALTLAATLGMTLGMPGIAPSAQAAPACPSTGDCYFLYWEQDDTRHGILSPDTDYCYPMIEGAVKGYNATNQRIYLYKSRACEIGSGGYVDPGYSWSNDQNVFYSFDFVGP